MRLAVAGPCNPLQPSRAPINKTLVPAAEVTLVVVTRVDTVRHLASMLPAIQAPIMNRTSPRAAWDNAVHHAVVDVAVEEGLAVGVCCAGACTAWFGAGWVVLVGGTVLAGGCCLGLAARDLAGMVVAIPLLPFRVFLGEPLAALGAVFDAALPVLITKVVILLLGVWAVEAELHGEELAAGVLLAKLGVEPLLGVRVFGVGSVPVAAIHLAGFERLVLIRQTT